MSHIWNCARNSLEISFLFLFRSKTEPPCSTVRRIMYRYLIYLCDRTRCQSIRKGDRPETGRSRRKTGDRFSRRGKGVLPARQIVSAPRRISVESYWGSSSLSLPRPSRRVQLSLARILFQAGRYLSTARGKRSDRGETENESKGRPLNAFAIFTVRVLRSVAVDRRTSDAIAILLFFRFVSLGCRRFIDRIVSILSKVALLASLFVG